MPCPARWGGRGFPIAVQRRWPGACPYSLGANMRSRLWQLPYGDQALFMERRVFDDLGGFPEVALLEDLMLVKALRKQGRIALSNQAVYSSARKWRQHGLLRTTLVNQLILAGFFWPVAPVPGQDLRCAKVGC